MQKVRVELGERSYDIVIDSGTLSGIGERMKEFRFSPKTAVISNPTVFGLYGDIVTASLKNAGFECFSVIIPDGEGYKNYEQTYYILTELLKNRLDRNSCVIALGGGVIGDITGFAASIYMRGIHFIQVPTTLLSQVDSSVGGKTGVNHELGKNMIGTFYQPKLVWIDIDTIKTLPKREFLCGIAEIIKYGVIWDGELFEFLAHNRASILTLDAERLTHIIKRSCEIKAYVVSKDERESGLRAILNYGHTVGHAVETETGYSKFLHGEAVAIGMHIEARLSEIMGFIDKKQVSEIKALIDAYGLPSELPAGMNADNLISHMRLDKKTEAGEMKFILPEKIGKVRIQKGINIEDITKALSKGQ
ncbi:MAG: 3-dehydroquinate synthase [Nitrospirae bacterium]|nr:3-dehydroquinate synthase [Nitrospirota bacterium]MCL5976901.1 3-dehydroquinate synthase [Nitrospirota bacterium]